LPELAGGADFADTAIYSLSQISTVRRAFVGARVALSLSEPTHTFREDQIHCHKSSTPSLPIRFAINAAFDAGRLRVVVHSVGLHSN
jgi:hypothetical protein